MSFADLAFESDHFGGVRARHVFANGFGVSVIKTHGSVGWCADLYELAVLKDDDLCYTTDITDDVIGYLTADDISKIMSQVALLDKDGHLPAGVAPFFD